MKFRFLDFELDESLYELRFGGEIVATQARVFAMITYLLHHRDRVVSKEELIRELWRAQAISDTAISQVVMLARKALHDEGDSQHIIKTVRGRGFRFIAQVEPATAQAEAANPARDNSPTTDTSNANVAQLSGASSSPLLSPARAPTAAGAAMIGREVELATLVQRLAALGDGRGGLVLIEGEPGIGKTTLACELHALAGAQGVDVQWGRAWEEGGAPPFWPWIQVLRGLVATEGEDRVRAFMGRGSAELLALLPELAASEDAGSSEVDRARAHFRLFDAMASFLRRACAASDLTPNSGKRARLFILDDLHAVDEASVQMLRFLAPELEAAGLLVVGTFRDLELQRQPVLAQLASGCAESQRVRLKSLDENHVTRWLTHKFGRVPSVHLARCLHDASGGNPLLLAELSRRFDRDHPESFAELRALANEPLPERILRAVRSHLGELPPDTLEALSAASALGREFALSTLAALRACSEAALLEQLAPALLRGVVQRAPHADHLIFSHAMVCHAVYAALPPPKRLELHRQIAELLERTHPTSHAPLYEIAHHYALAAAGGCRRQALHYARQAALQAAEMSAFEVAAELYDRAVQLAEADATELGIVHELLCAAGQAWYRVGQLEHATARYDRAAALARAAHDPQRHGQAVLSSALAVRGAVLYDGVRQNQLRAALDMLPPDDSPLRAGLLAASAISLRGGTAAERDAISRESIEMARRLNDDRALQYILNTRHLALWGAAHPREMLALSHELLALARKTGDTDVLMDALVWQMSDHTELGDTPSMRRAHENYRFEVERSGDPWHRYMLFGFDVIEAQMDGDFGRAQEASERAWQWGLRLREPTSDAFFAVRNLFLQFDEGLIHGDPRRRAASCIQEPPACVPSEYRPFWALSWAITDKSVDAERSVTQFLALDAAQLVLDPMRRPLLCVMAQVCVLLGDTPQAARIYPLLLPDVGLHSHLHPGVYLGPVSYYLGILAASLSDLEAAMTHFDRALVECQQSLPWRTRAHYAYGSALIRNASKPQRAAELLHEALANATKIGMADLREATRRELEH